MSVPQEGTVAVIDTYGRSGALAIFRHGDWWTDAEVGGGAVSGTRHDLDDVTVINHVAVIEEGL